MKPVLFNGAITNATMLTPDDLIHKRVICPACGTFEFQMWPEGWDGHAGHKCEGVNEGTSEARKAEYKSKLGYLFR